jgi:hypothetical protein
VSYIVTGLVYLESKESAMMLQSLLTSWSFEPLVLISLGAAALLYLRGVVYTSKLGLSPHLRWCQIAYFYLGLLVVFIPAFRTLD